MHSSSVANEFGVSLPLLVVTSSHAWVCGLYQKYMTGDAHDGSHEARWRCNVQTSVPAGYGENAFGD
jgi:hypothetical protein